MVIDMPDVSFEFLRVFLKLLRETFLMLIEISIHLSHESLKLQVWASN